MGFNTHLLRCHIGRNWPTALRAAEKTSECERLFCFTRYCSAKSRVVTANRLRAGSGKAIPGIGSY
jgi:hypothetical protein